MPMDEATDLALASRHAQEGTLFQKNWYESRSGLQFDTLEAALQHYFREGERAGVSPHPLFWPHYYRWAHEEVDGSALDHFQRFGDARRLQPNPLFDPWYYARIAGLEAGAAAFVHYLTRADYLGAQPHPYFDAARYVAMSGPCEEEPLQRFFERDLQRGVPPSAWVQAAFMQRRETDHRYVWTGGKWDLVDRLAEQVASLTGAPVEEERIRLLRDWLALFLTCHASGAAPSLVCQGEALFAGGLDAASTIHLPPGLPWRAWISHWQTGEKKPKDISSQIPSPALFFVACDWKLSGANSYVRRVSRGLTEQGASCALLATRSREDFECHEEPNGLPVIHLLEREDGLAELHRQLVRFSEAHPGSLFVFNYDFLAGGSIPALSPRAGVVIILQSDDAEYYEFANRVGMFCDRVVAVSQKIACRVRELDSRLSSRLCVISPGGAAELGGEVRGRRNPTPRFVYSGRVIEHQKRVSRLHDLLQAARRSQWELRLDLVGAGPDEPFLRALLAEEISRGRCLWHGPKSLEDSLCMVRAADFLFLPSDFEGMPLVLIEALESGTIPVARRGVSGVDELIRDGENGLLFDEGDWDQLVPRLSSLWSEERVLREMRLAAMASVEEAQYSLEGMVGAFAEMVEQVRREVEHGSTRCHGQLSHGLTLWDYSVSPWLLPDLTRAKLF